ncbi:MAG: EamA family transporter, partial [Gammaproteobacteria bacterium]|nr:EamA family transporter [Gammaproteobacteria bacterium]
VGVAKATTVAYLIPVFATLWGALFIDEPVTAIMLVGGVVILLGTSLVTGVISMPSKTVLTNKQP